MIDTIHLDNSNECSCDVPCKRKSYDVSLSYAQLSKYNIERLIVSNTTKRQLVSDRLKAAVEASRRVDPGNH